jgi:hypothetical protein
MTEPNPNAPEGLPVELVSGGTDPLVRLVAILLGAALLVAIGAISFLVATDHAAPDVLQNVAVGALAALSALAVGNRAH